MRDDQITRLLRTLDEPAAPEREFADRLFEELTRRAGRSGHSHLGLLLVAALVLMSTLSVGLAVGSGLLKVPWVAVEATPGPSGLLVSSTAATPSVAPSSAATPSAIPTPVVTVPAGILRPGSVATVVVDGLRLRSDHSTTASVRRTLAKGDTVTIVHSILVPLPVIVAGASWYFVQISTDPTSGGWVAAGEDGTTFLTLSSPTTCEDLQASTVTLAQLIEAGSWHRLACLGDTPVTLTGVIDCRCTGSAGPGVYEPAWLVDVCPTQSLTPAETVTQDIHDTLDMVAAPGGPSVQPRGTIVRVTGHFADASSKDCVTEPAGVYEPGVWEGAAPLLCQEQFVITELEKIGFMELPPIG